MEIFNGYCFSKSTQNRLTQALTDLVKDSTPVLLCLGTDRVLADCLGPIVAEKLRGQNYPSFVYGGLKAPITSQNCNRASAFIRAVHSDETLLVVDSMITDKQSRLGEIVISDSYMGLNKENTPIAPIYIYGITSKRNSRSLLAQSRLFLISVMAEIISSSLMEISNIHDSQYSRQNLNIKNYIDTHYN